MQTLPHRRRSGRFVPREQTETGGSSRSFNFTDGGGRKIAMTELQLLSPTEVSKILGVAAYDLLTVDDLLGALMRDSEDEPDVSQRVPVVVLHGKRELVR